MWQQWPCRYAWSGRNYRVRCFHQRLDLTVGVVLGPRWLPNHTRRTTKCVPLRPSAYLLLHHHLLLGVATNMPIRMKTKLGGFGSLLTTIAISHFKHCQKFCSVFDAHLKKVKIHWATPEGSEHFLGGKFHFGEIFVHANGMEIR